MIQSCPLCTRDGETLLWRGDHCRIILIDDTDYPGYCRVVWNSHVREMTDLSAAQRMHFMQAVFATEAALRELLEPAKINLASLGNQTPHLHWHVIPRYRDDAHFPAPVWAARLRSGVIRPAPGADMVADKIYSLMKSCLAQTAILAG